METRKVISPNPPAPLPTFEGDGDKNRFLVATPHFTATFRRVAAAASYAGTKFDIAVPTSLAERIVYADIAAESGVPDVGNASGEIRFYNGGSPVLVLPFDFLPGASAATGRTIGFHVTGAAISNTPINTLGVDLGTAARVFVPGWVIKINCSKIEVCLSGGTASATDACYVILGCFSQGRDA
jgi:hypothetical protein